MNNDPEVILDKLEYFAKGEYEGNEVSTLRVYLYYALEYLEAADSDAMLRVHEWLCTPPIEDNEFTFLSDMMKEAMGQ